MGEDSKHILVIGADSRDSLGLADAATVAAPVASRLTWDNVATLAQGLDRLVSNKFAVILLVLPLPEDDGFDALVELRQAQPEIPVIVLSALSDPGAALEAMRQGAEDYLIKSQVDGAALVHSIDRAIERKRTATELRRQREQFATLHEINLAIASTLDLPTAIDRLLGRIHRLLPEYSSALRLRDKRTGLLESFASWNLDTAEWMRSNPSVGTGLLKPVIESKMPVAVTDVLSDARTYHREFFERFGFVSYLGCPLIFNDELIGVLSFFTKKRHVFDAAEIEFLTMVGSQAAVAIQNCRLYEQAKAANEALEKALEVRSTLIGVMAHELKNPIQVILGSANLLAGGVFGELTPEQQTRVQTIEKSALELGHLIESSIDMARVESGNMILKVTEVSVTRMLGDLHAEFQTPYRHKGLDLTIEIPTLEVTIVTDGVKLKEILRNLIENARKYTAKGRVSVRIEQRQEGIEFFVSDTGQGIASELLPKIFELFYQEDASKRERASAGFGLNIVKRLVAAMNGEITVSSEVGKGSTFRVRLPLVIEAMLGYS